MTRLRVVRELIAAQINDNHWRRRVRRWSDGALGHEGLAHEWLNPSPPQGVLANSNPILVGAGSVFNLAGTMDEPIVGLMQPGATPEEALELLPFYVDQAERILRKTELTMQVSLVILETERHFSEYSTATHERNQSGTDREQTPENPERFP